MQVPGLSCGVCGDDELFAIAPGASAVVGFLDIVLVRGVAPGAWCEDCWPYARHDVADDEVAA